MASSSAASASASRKRKYDVFLSFRGEDTRYNFTSHLYDALCCKKIKTFIDNDLQRGEEIAPSLLRVIEDSLISVIIFSKNYASSPWCLDEMSKILECKETRGNGILPVFYHVNPSEVEEQSGCFADALLQLQMKYKDQLENLPRWRADLTTVASLSGHASQDIRYEAKLVKEIVEDILKKLNHAYSRNLKGLIGIDSHVEQITKLLHLETPEICILGIWGMGGIGKTTIAEVIFNKFSSEFEGCCFLKNIKEESVRSGLLGLRKMLRQDVDDLLQRKKVLLVLDDVDCLNQLDEFIGKCDFGAGTRIIVTSRDKQVLKNRVDELYEVKGLNHDEALQLFSLIAFRQNHLAAEYADPSIRVINYAQGNPLALKVLGSFLFGRGKQEWESTLHKLGRVPRPEILSILRASFDTLDEEEKCIFLDIACFFKGQQVDFVQSIMDGCGFSAGIGISVLVDKCLITVVENKLEMHDLLQEMAHEIVRQESIKELGKRSRLWSHADVYRVLTKNLGTEKVEGIFLDTSKIPKVMLSSRAFANMHNLRLLKIYNSGFGNNCKLYLPDGLDFLSEKLIYFHWEEYPLSSMPSNFAAENLVELNLTYSNIKQLWSGVQCLASLKELNLSNCMNLLTFPDLSLAKNLKSLNFSYCTGLAEVNPSIRYLDQLIDLDMRCCTSLMSLPTGTKWRSLKTLNLSGCSYLQWFPEFTENLTYLNLNETAIQVLPESIGNSSELIALNLKDCKQLRNLPESMHLLKSLSIVDLSGCSNITRFPNICGEVKYLYLSETALVEIPSSIGLLSKLLYLDLMNCKRLENLPGDISNLACLEQLVLSGCSSITKFPKVSIQVKKLLLDGTSIQEIPSSIQYCFELVELNLRNCTSLHTLPSTICKLKHLQKLNLSGCCMFDDFPEILEDMNSLRYLYLDGTAIKKLPSPIQKLKALSSLQLKNCRYLCQYGVMSFDNLPKEGLRIQYLSKLYLNNCGLFCVPHWIGCLSALEALDLSGNPFKEITFNLKGLVELQYLGLRNCILLESLSELPPNIAKLDAHGCLNLKSVAMDPYGSKANIVEFIFTNCNMLSDDGKHQILSFGLTKFQLYATRLQSQNPSSTLAGESSFCFPRSHNDMELYGLLGYPYPSFETEIQLPSGWAKNDVLGFVLCVVIAFKGVSDHSSGFRVKCRYHFQNENGDFIDFHSYFGSWYDTRIVKDEHIFFGFDPYVHLTNGGDFGKYNKVSIQFWAQDISGHSLRCCFVVGCGASILTKYTCIEDFQKKPKLEEWRFQGSKNYSINQLSKNVSHRQQCQLVTEQSRSEDGEKQVNGSEYPRNFYKSSLRDKHEVFLIFNEKDTCKNFTSCLYYALHRRGINTFLDYNGGTGIRHNKNEISIVVFSRNYASSALCLDQIVEIYDCMTRKGQTVLPVFYDVDQFELLGDLDEFEVLEDVDQFEVLGFGDAQLERESRWKFAVTGVANLCGWALQDRDESKLIEEIVDGVVKKLRNSSPKLHSSEANNLFSKKKKSEANNLIRINSRLEEMMNICLGGDGVEFVGICGMGGIGKTFIARALYQQLSYQFEGSCFLANVRELESKFGLISLQQQLLSETLMERDVRKVWNTHSGMDEIKNQLRHKRVLIVLDDVSGSEQLVSLAGMQDWFGCGSRIIITTRDEHLLVSHGVEKIYKVQGLNHNESFSLFCFKAFKNDCLDYDYVKIADQFVSYADGLPLALDVLGRFLFGKSIDEWESALARSMPNKQILDKLCISFDRLEEVEKKIFLNIACFFKGEEKDYVVKMLESCGFYPENGIKVLLSKSLITICNERIWMHDLLEEMGREIVRQSCYDREAKKTVAL